MQVTNVQTHKSPLVGRHEDMHDDLKFGGAGTVPAWTILARDSSDDTLIPYVKGGSTNGNGIPVAVLMVETTATGSGNVRTLVLTQGRLLRSLCKIAAQGDASQIDESVKGDLATVGITLLEHAEHSIRDNQ